jgi:uncharacterized membrane-anchored protein
MNKILREDIQSIIADNNIPWSTLINSSVLITGATGLIGGLLARALHEASLALGLGVKIVVTG